MEGKIIYPEQDTVHTYREIIHQYTAQHPWAELGNDICLGAEADRPISVRDEMFAPFYLLRYANGAVIQAPTAVRGRWCCLNRKWLKGVMWKYRKNSLGLRHCPYGYFSFVWRG